MVRANGNERCGKWLNYHATHFQLRKKKQQQAMLALNASNLEVHSLNENRRPSPIAEKS